MKFHAEFSPRPFSKKINYGENILLIGSCFTEHMGSRLAAHKFSVLENPNGILFNPVSICRAITAYTEQKKYCTSDLFYENELYGSWDFHTKFSSPGEETALQQMNDSVSEATKFLEKTDWIIITLGSAWVYEIIEENEPRSSRVVANCHKLPANTFSKRMLSVSEVIIICDEMIAKVRVINPDVNFIFTVSPVRHLREGFVENNRSKAALILAVEELEKREHCFYFPAYELVMDDLRDYRFYAEDLVHPNYAATNYVWEKFMETAIDASAKILMEKINELNAAMAHRAFNPTSTAHQKFLAANLQKAKEMAGSYTDLNFDKEIAFFSTE